jgi:hypothetical protein
VISSSEIPSGPSRSRSGRRLGDHARLGELLVGRLAARQQRDEPLDEVLGRPRHRLAGERVLPEDHRQQVEARDRVRVLAEPAEQRVLDQLEDLAITVAGEVADAPMKPNVRPPASEVSSEVGRFCGWIAAHASLKSVPSSPTSARERGELRVQPVGRRLQRAALLHLCEPLLLADQAQEVGDDLRGRRLDLTPRSGS